jgi:hypothetical protein
MRTRIYDKGDAVPDFLFARDNVKAATFGTDVEVLDGERRRTMRPRRKMADDEYVIRVDPIDATKHLKFDATKPTLIFNYELSAEPVS